MEARVTLIRNIMFQFAMSVGLIASVLLPSATTYTKEATSTLKTVHLSLDRNVSTVCECIVINSDTIFFRFRQKSKIFLTPSSVNVIF